MYYTTYFNKLTYTEHFKELNYDIIKLNFKHYDFLMKTIVHYNYDVISCSIATRKAEDIHKAGINYIV